MEQLLATFAAIQGEQWTVGSWTVQCDSVAWNGHGEYLTFAVNTVPPGTWWAEAKVRRADLEGRTVLQVTNALKAHVEPQIEAVQTGAAENAALADMAGTEL